MRQFCFELRVFALAEPVLFALAPQPVVFAPQLFAPADEAEPVLFAFAPVLPVVLAPADEVRAAVLRPVVEVFIRIHLLSVVL